MSAPHSNLVLTRRTGQKIIIGDEEVIITVVDIDKRGQVRLRFNSPKTTAINREEIYIQKK